MLIISVLFLSVLVSRFSCSQTSVCLIIFIVIYMCTTLIIYLLVFLVVLSYNSCKHLGFLHINDTMGTYLSLLLIVPSTRAFLFVNSMRCYIFKSSFFLPSIDRYSEKLALFRHEDSKNTAQCVIHVLCASVCKSADPL